MPLGEEVVNDYRFLRLSLRAHPAQFLRADLSARKILRNEALRGLANNTRVKISGLVTCRQRPGSAKGVVFMTIEDESAVANVIACRRRAALSTWSPTNSKTSRCCWRGSPNTAPTSTT
jgi:error-prone DNA polymerase